MPNTGANMAVVKSAVGNRKKKSLKMKEFIVQSKFETIEGMVEACVVIDSTELC